MNGQWVGTYIGTTNGNAVVDIDERPDCFQGTAFLIDSDRTLPISAISFRTPDKSNRSRFRTVEMFPWNVRTNRPFNLHLDPRDKADFDAAYPNVNVSKSVEVEYDSSNPEFLSFSWKTDLGSEGVAKLPKSKAKDASVIQAETLTWGEFKARVPALCESKHIFRGQRRQWRLRTAFHRRGRAELWRFMNEDIRDIHRQVSALTKHWFDIDRPDEFGSFCHLLQHHGYPMPFLDWTFSPYVAAFFAYRQSTQENVGPKREDEFVRIHVFDQQNWRERFPQYLFMSTPWLHISVAEFIAKENNRMIPQQAISLVTNVDDVESYIQDQETAGKRYLSAFDISSKERKDVLRELRYMGITSGSLLPGLDGACEELAQKHFEF